MAYAAAVLNLVAVPLGLSVAPASVLTVAVIADFPLHIWLLIVSISMLVVKREAKAKTSAYGGLVNRRCKLAQAPRKTKMA